MNGMSPEYSLAGFCVTEPQKEYGKSTVTEFIYAVISSGEFTLQAAGNVRDSKLAGFYCLLLTLSTATMDL